MSQLHKHLSEIYETEVSLNGETLSQFEKVLSRYNEWISIKREIRLNNLFDDKKLQFDIDDISEYGFFGDDEVDISLSKTCFLLKSMSFILKNEKVEKLEIKWRVLNTQNGAVLKNLLDHDINLDIKMRFKENTFFYFYVDVPELKKVA